jgi:hypothetical protein
MADQGSSGDSAKNGGTKSALLGSVNKQNLIIAGIAAAIPILGVVGILVYTGANSTFGVGLVAAIAAAAVGLVVGLLFGVPRAISSGAARQNVQASNINLHSVLKPESFIGTEDNTPQQQTNVGSEVFISSTNLAEVSDWLTKLLLGAGLVSITRLGGPVGRLIDSTAAGLSTSSSVSGSAKVVAGAILFGFFAMGFLDGYILTTVWYKRELAAGSKAGDGKAE